MNAVESKPKQPKNAVAFEHPARGMDHCEDCKFFIAKTERCKKVAGVIEPKDWCKLFKAKRERDV